MRWMIGGMDEEEVRLVGGGAHWYGFVEFAKGVVGYA